MDVARSCYTTAMRFWPEQPVQAVKWYFCDPAAQPFPTSHRFGSLNYLSPPTPDSGVGEVIGYPRPWRNGSRPPDADGAGHFCGQLEWFQNGAPKDAPRLQRRVDGLAVCCTPGVKRGGDVDGGGGLDVVPISNNPVGSVQAIIIRLTDQPIAVWRIGVGGVSLGGTSSVSIA